MALKKDLSGFKNSPVGKYVYYALIIGAVIAVIIVVVKIYQGFKDAANAAGDLLTDSEIGTASGVSTDRVSSIRTLAQTLWDKNTHSITFGLIWYYDCDNFINAVNNMVGAAEVKLLNRFYMQDGGESLNNVFTVGHGFYGSTSTDRINADNWATIQTL